MRQQTYVADFKHNWAQNVLLSQQQRLQQDSTGAGFQGTRVGITKMNAQVIITSEKDKKPAQRKGQNPVSRNESSKRSTRAHLARLPEYLVPFSSLMIF